MLTNCKNCGAPLHDCKCEYCGTIYMDGYRIVEIESTLANEDFAEIMKQVKTIKPISNIRRL